MKHRASLPVAFHSFCERYHVLLKGTKIIVGVSGGADSMALLQLLWQSRMEKQYSILVAHVNYQLRGEESKQDAEFVKNYCFDRNIPIVIKEVKLASEKGIENQARTIRREFFLQIKQQYNMDCIALAHHQEDQSETIMLHIARGAGYTGLHGILPQHGDFVHPLLFATKAEIEDYLTTQQLGWRIDSSNLSDDYGRNKVRNHILPYMQENLNTAIHQHFYQMGLIFADTDLYMRDVAQHKMKSLAISQDEDFIVLDANGFAGLNRILQFYVARLAFSSLTSMEQDFYQTHVESILSLMKTNGTKQLHLPNGVLVQKEYDRISFSLREKEELVLPDATMVIAHLKPKFVFGEYRITMKKLKLMPDPKLAFRDPDTAYLDADKVEFPIVLRFRRDGDRFHPFGKTGSRKLKEFFIDEKVPKFERDSILLVTDQEKICWVASMRVDQRVAITDQTKSILLIHVEKVTHARMRSAARVR